MGNAQSDQGEQEAYNSWIKYIPVANVGYSLVRAVTYAAKGDVSPGRIGHDPP